MEPVSNGLTNNSRDNRCEVKEAYRKSGNMRLELSSHNDFIVALTNLLWTEVIEGCQEDSKRSVDSDDPSKGDQVVEPGQCHRNLE